MCRIFGYIDTDENNNLNQAVSLFADLAEKGCVPCGVEAGHNDGWGVSMWGKEDQLYYRSCVSANAKKVLDVINSKKESYTHGFMHLRKGTKAKVAVENTHPFLISGTAFCHNGSIYKFPEDKFKDNYIIREGDTDSELLFLRIISRLGSNIKNISLDSLSVVLKEEVEEIKKYSDWTALIVLMGNKNGLVLNYLWNEKYIESESLCFEKYYTFYIGKKGSETILCSEKLQIDGFVWEQLKNDSLLVFPVIS